MSQSVDFKIVYDGESLRNHSMNVKYLAPSLLSLSNLFDEANKVLNGNKTSLKLQIKAHEAGSFEILLELHQSISSQLTNFLTSDFVVSILKYNKKRS
jgi:hypothetical protein